MTISSLIQLMPSSRKQMCQTEGVSKLLAASSAGYNVCIFAYGQTGSGKTHTMAGTDVASPAGRGINYRALDDVFAINAARAGEVWH